VFRYRRADNGDLIAIDEMLASLHLDWPQHKLLGLPLRRTAATRASRIRVVADALIKASPLVRFRREMAESMRGPGAHKSQRMIMAGTAHRLPDWRALKMAKQQRMSGIAWTDTINFWMGCTRVQHVGLACAEKSFGFFA
jgi:hypothetical protein